MPQKISLCYIRKYLFSCQFYSNRTLQILYALINTVLSSNWEGSGGGEETEKEMVKDVS